MSYKMNVSMLFKARITTEETYPSSIELKFKRNIETRDFFEEAYQFIESTINGKIVGVETTCLGILEVICCKPEDLEYFHNEGLKEL